MNLTINVQLKRDRNRLGEYELITADGERLMGPCVCLAKSDDLAARAAGNPGRDPLKPMGDMPTGLYLAAIIGPLLPARSYGLHQVIALDPVAGPARVAKDQGRRSGILVHPGPLNPAYTWWRGLRPTHGCMRTLDPDHVQLLKLIASFPHSTLHVNVSEA